ncbi:hypothetical protein RI129_004355 [Pyrocoelia pectoralis]|uniref:Uncharacterized protein n=1 Tax=Pyrocoelia pectoralis TaxID=417401 RepID=A0AAN7ZQK6_9COLE
MHTFDIWDVQFSPAELKLSGKLIFGDLKMFSNYIMQGHIINYPITGDGFFKGMVGPSNISFEMKGEQVKGKYGDKVTTLKYVKLEFKISRMLMQFEGLVIEKGPWGRTNEVFTRMQEDAATAMGPVLERIFETYVERYIRWLLQEIPFSNIFPCCSSESIVKVIDYCEPSSSSNTIVFA